MYYLWYKQMRNEPYFKQIKIMETIFKIIGGGQKVQQNVQHGLSTEFERVDQSDWTEKSLSSGSNSFTNVMWSTDLNNLQSWANEWAGQEAELVEKQTA